MSHGISQRTGVESSVEHGRVAGTLISAFTLVCMLEVLLRAMRGQRSVPSPPQPDPQPPEIGEMARETMSQQQRAMKLVLEVEHELRLARVLPLPLHAGKPEKAN